MKTPQVPALAGMTPLGVAKKPTNPYRISVRAALENADVDYDVDGQPDLSALMDSVVPACCSEGCEVEPDGRCEHGCPAVTLALGVI